MTVKEMIEFLSKLNPNAKLTMVTDPKCPSFWDVKEACYFQELPQFSDHFDTDGVYGEGVVFLTGVPQTEE